jgi:hypothetical protein
MAITRRALLLALGGTATSALACSRREAPAAAARAASPEAPVIPPASASPPPLPPAAALADAAPPRGATRIATWSIAERGPTGEVAVVLPDDSGGSGPGASGTARWPLVVALHGHGEAMKGPVDGKMGWPRDYALPHAIDRVANPPLTADDVEGFVDADRLAGYNAQLAARPYGGLVVVCPYLPDLNLFRAADLADYGRYIAEVVIPKARRELPVLAAPESTGIDGVSLGGATAMRVGLAHVETFGAVGALQPAIVPDQQQEWVELYRAARARRPSLAVRLTTSLDDVYEGTIVRLSQALRAAGVGHDFADIPGPHDYPFNRGPGAIELLLWHDRVLARA